MKRSETIVIENKNDDGNELNVLLAMIAALGNNQEERLHMPPIRKNTPRFNPILFTPPQNPAQVVRIKNVDTDLFLTCFGFLGFYGFTEALTANDVAYQNWIIKKSSDTTFTLQCQATSAILDAALSFIDENEYYGQTYMSPFTGSLSQKWAIIFSNDANGFYIFNAATLFKIKFLENSLSIKVIAC